MITLKSGRTVTADDLSLVEQIYLDAFPPEERREWSDIIDMLAGNERFDMMTAWDSDMLIGFITIWDLGEFVFLEHFATSPQARNKGYGAKIFSSILRSDERPHVIEVERPDTEMAARRIGFYERLGMKITDKDYNQPPYKQGGNPIPMHIMCDKDGYNTNWAKSIHTTVYKFC